jgi:cell wall assembly regulator SMI1
MTPMRPQLQAELERLQALLARHGAPFTRRPGASDLDVARAERRTGIRMDEDLRALYRFSNGSEYEESWFAVHTDQLQAFRLCPLDEVCTLHGWQRTQLDAARNNGGVPWDPRARRYDSHTRWLPFADFGNGNALLLFDADPAPGGHYGQVLSYQHEPDAIRYCATGLVALLRESNALLEAHGEELLGEA